jgi:ketosteroid isomerase-like protein
MPGAGRRSLSKEKSRGDDRTRRRSVVCAFCGHAATGSSGSDLNGVAQTNPSGVGGTCGAAGSPVTIGGGTMNDPIAPASDGHGTATALAGIPAMRRAVLMDVFATMDAGDLDGMVKHLTDDVTTRFGNHPEICGKAAFGALFNEVGQAVCGLRHDILDLWHAVEDFDVWVVQLNVSYRLLDGRTITLPCCNVFRMRGELICEYRVYMDIGPVLDEAAARGM